MIIYTKKHKIPIKISREDFKCLGKLTWNINGRGYVQRNFRLNGKSSSIRMHQMILGVFPKGCGKEIDHTNGDLKDNRRSNLRIVTRSQNLSNRRLNGIRKRSKKWECYTSYMGKYFHIGVFKTKKEAKIALMNKHREINGKYSFFSR